MGGAYVSPVQLVDRITFLPLRMSTATDTTSKLHFFAYVPETLERAVYDHPSVQEGVTYAKRVLGPQAQVYTYPTPQDYTNPFQHKRVA